MSDGLRVRRLRIYLALLISLALTIPVAFLVPDLFPEFRAPLAGSGFIDKPGGCEYYEDLDRDGFSERIILFNNTLQEASVKIIEENGTIGAHYYLRGQTLRYKTNCSFCDYDSSGYLRIFIFTATRDSLLLSCIDPVKKKDFEFRDRFVTGLNQRNGTHDFTMDFIRFADLNNDRNKELITTIMAGFPLKPRIGIIYDPANDTLITGRDQGTFFSVIDIRDIHGDGVPELFTVNYSIWNYPDSCRGNAGDHQAGILVFDRNFNPLFEPVMFPGRYIHAYTLPAFDKKGSSRLVTLLTCGDTLISPVRLILSDITGRMLKEIILPWNEGIPWSPLWQFDEFPGLLLLSDNRGNISLISPELETVRSFKLHDTYATYIESADFDFDGEMEYLFQTGGQRIPVIYRAGFSAPVVLEFPVGIEAVRTGMKLNGDQPQQLFLQQADQYYLFDYGRNPYYLLKIPFFLCIFLGFFGLIMFSQYLQRVFLKQQHEAGRKIAALQLMLVNNQLDPHFTFNAMNAISASILNEKPEEANRRLMALSRLMRAGVKQSGSLTRTLAEELEFLTGYLDLMKNRMDSAFSYDIDLTGEPDLTMQIPGMITQIYVENAIKHGLRPLKEGGRLRISVSSNPRELSIEIEDNGIGRAKARTNGSDGTGKGIQVMDQAIGIINNFNTKKIRLNITDLQDTQGQPTGTIVTVTIPMDMNYQFFKG